MRIFLKSVIFIVLLFSASLVTVGLADAQYAAIQPKTLAIKVVHEIKFDKTSYLTSETVKITVTDSTFNSDSKTAETVTVIMYSKLNTAQKKFVAKETDLSSGVFIVNVKVSDITIEGGDTITAYYNYVSDGRKGQATTTATTSVPLKVIPIQPYIPKAVTPYVPPPPTIELDKKSYLSTDSIIVTIPYVGANKDSNKQETVNFVLFSKTNPKGDSFLATETGPNSGIFELKISMDKITTVSDTITAALTGEYSNIKASAAVTAVAKLALKEEVEKLEATTIEQSKVQTALDDLYLRKVSETTVKSTSELLQVIKLNENTLVSKQSVLTSKLQQGNNPLELLKEREEYVRAKIDYLSQKGEYVKRGQATQEETKEFNDELKELVIERKALSYDSLTKKFEKKIDSKRIESLKADVKPKKLIVQRLDTKIQNLKDAANPVEYASKVGLELKNNRVKVLVDLSSIPPSARDKIESLGGQIEAESQRQVQLNIFFKY
jgi:hypothetical protein